MSAGAPRSRVRDLEVALDLVKAERERLRKALEACTYVRLDCVRDVARRALAKLEPADPDQPEPTYDNRKL